jgi:uncharacterized protein (DUF488 family)
MSGKPTVQTRLGEDDADFYTAGYEKKTVDELFRMLKEAGVRCLVDVRESPWSQVPDYCKDTLENRHAELGESCGYHIRYISMPALGNPQENRKSDRPMAEIMMVYRQHALSKTMELEELYDILKKCKTALMCYEADPAECHRSALAAIIEEKYGLTYADLRTRG